MPGDCATDDENAGNGPRAFPLLGGEGRGEGGRSLQPIIGSGRRPENSSVSAERVSQREPKERKVRKGRAATKELRAWGESNNALRNRTRPDWRLAIGD